VRRLTRFEYDNTIRDLTGLDLRPASRWLTEAGDTGFDNDAATQKVTVPQADQFMGAAEEVAGRVVDSLPSQLACAAAGDRACGMAFVEGFARRAYRRPLHEPDRALLARVLDAGIALGGFKEGVRLALETILQSADFMYRYEAADTGATGRLSDHALASRLSYFLWGSMPDEALVQAAEAGKLRTTAEVAAHARRMLADPRARAAVAHAYRQWLNLEQVDSAMRDPRKFPGFTGDVARALRGGTEAFLTHVTLEAPGGTLGELLGARYAFVNQATAPIYGLAGVTGTDLRRVEIVAGNRSGLVTDAGLLAGLASYDHTSVVGRGVFVRQQLLCQTLVAAPDDVPDLPALPPDLTTRELFTQHRANPACSGCHALIDPIGLGFESYDALGRFRTEENGKPIDASGELRATRDIDGAFQGALELAARLAGSAEVRSCVARQWFRYAFARADIAADACALEELAARLSAGASLRELLVTVTQLPAFYAAPAATRVDASDEGACTP
jgi:hypothetical protein